MGHEVYANNNEIAGKAGTGKVVAAFPDVCLSPPSPPAGPIPVPYPDTSFSSDLKEGTRSVKLGGKPAAVLMSLEDFASWQETDYLLRSPANAARLREAISELDAGGGQARDLIEE